MAATSGGERCRYCWRQVSYQPGLGERLHNKGCPADILVHVAKHGSPLPELRPNGPYVYDDNDSTNHVIVYREYFREWRRGYLYGFDDNYIQPWRYRNYSVTFLMGYQVGKAEIDRLVDDAAQSRCFG